MGNAKSEAKNEISCPRAAVGEPSFARRRTGRLARMLSPCLAAQRVARDRGPSVSERRADEVCGANPRSAVLQFVIAV